jgi:L-amino acid N-acyltransferase YncA
MTTTGRRRAHIRPATPADAERICAIYNHYVTTTTVSFEEDAVSEQEMAQRIADVGAAGLPWLVLEVDGILAGYAYATRWRVRPAYRHSVESSVYLDRAFAGRGFGRLLYGTLLDALRARELQGRALLRSRQEVRELGRRRLLGAEARRGLSRYVPHRTVNRRPGHYDGCIRCIPERPLCSIWIFPGGNLLRGARWSTSPCSSWCDCPDGARSAS